MAIRAGQILHFGANYLIDRIQTGGPGDLTITRNKIYEVGNYQSVGISQENPTLSFNLEALDVSSDIEINLTGSDPLMVANGSTVDFTYGSFYMDIISPWKSPYGKFDSVHGAAIPYLGLESVSYRFGVTDNAGETFTLQGDSIFYCEGRPVIQHHAIPSTGGTPIAPGGALGFVAQPGPWSASGNPFGNPITCTAIPYNDQGVEKFALSVCKVSGATIDVVTGMVRGGAWTRLSYGTDYLDTAAGITLVTGLNAGEALSIVFTTADTAITDPSADTVNSPTLFGDYPQSIHHPPGTSIGGPLYPRPSALRGRDIELYIAPSGSPTFEKAMKWPEVQNVTVDWRITVEADYELGNALPYDRSPTDVPAVTGNVELRAKDIQSLFKRMQQITGVDPQHVIGPQSAVLTDMLLVLRNPATGGVGGPDDIGKVVKTLLIPSVRFTLPGYSAAANAKMNSTLAFDSDLGAMYVGKTVMTEEGGAPLGFDARVANLGLVPLAGPAGEPFAASEAGGILGQRSQSQTPSYIRRVGTSVSAKEE